jgi:hypothetical protein
MPALLELQRAMRRDLLAQTHYSDDPRHEEVFAIYRNTVTSTLVNALRLAYPAVLRLVGAEFFEGATREFIRTHAPRSACLNDYGQPLADFLGQFGPAATLPYLADVARLEWAVNCALHAEDAVALDLPRLASLGEAALPRVSFTAHPGLSLLRLEFPADAIWSAVLDQDNDAMARIDLSSGLVPLLIERGANGVQVRRLTAWAWDFTRALMLGKSLNAALDETPAPEADALNALLAEHLTSGRFIDFSCEGEPTP